MCWGLGLTLWFFGREERGRGWAEEDRSVWILRFDLGRQITLQGVFLILG